jgi:hypothetical protein
MIQYYVAVLLGGLIYLLFQLNSAFAKNGFRWKIFIKKNIIPFILNLTIGFTLVYIREDLINIYPITMLSALLLGVSGQVILQKIQDIFDPSKKTFIGAK